MAEFTPTQGRYLAYIHAYCRLHGCPPAETEIAMALRVSPPSAHLMVKSLEKKGLIERQPGQSRSIKVLVPADEIPDWDGRAAQSRAAKQAVFRPFIVDVSRTDPAVNVYVLKVSLINCQFGSRAAPKKSFARFIEIRGDQTLADLHEAIFSAYDRYDEHLYEFQFGNGGRGARMITYGMTGEENGSVRRTKMDELQLKPKQAFGYWFDFGDNWYHQIDVERIDHADLTIAYPRITKKVGKSPPQYLDPDGDDDDHD